MLLIARHHCCFPGSIQRTNCVSRLQNSKATRSTPLPATRVRLLRLAPAAATSPEVEQPPALDGESELPHPNKKLQPGLNGKERAALRAYSETLAKEKRLQRLQVGAQGITFNVLMACMDILMKHEYLRIKLGEGCGLERKQTAAQLADLLDAAVVGQVGFTITLYRKKGLPRPDNLVKTDGNASS